MSEEIEVTLVWSDPDAAYLGSQGETTTQMTRTALWKLIVEGQRDNAGNVVTSVTIWPALSPSPP
jgi:hypothetical protein